tara:strand:+ start:5076 stop:5654 length:579 start_codon:yes stop_codon:yes gene_type:complete
MTQVTSTPSISNIKELPTGVLTSPKTIVKLKFLSLNMATRDAVIRIQYKGIKGKEFITLISSAKLTVYAMKYLTSKRGVKDEDGNLTGEYLTNFERYLKKRELPIDTPLGDMEFESENHSEQYVLNPFSVRFNKKFEYATIELVNMPFKRPIVKHNPMNGKEEVVKYVYPMHRTERRVLNVGKAYYKRVIVR